MKELKSGKIWIRCKVISRRENMGKKLLIGFITLYLGIMFLSFAVVSGYHNNYDGYSTIIAVLIGFVLLLFSYLIQNTKKKNE